MNIRLTRKEALTRAKQGDRKAMIALANYYRSKGRKLTAYLWEQKARKGAGFSEYKRQDSAVNLRPKGKLPLILLSVLAILFIIVILSENPSPLGSPTLADGNQRSVADYGNDSPSHEQGIAIRYRGDDPFEGLYYAQSRKDVLAILGEPDSTRRPASAQGNTDVYDSYENILCCGHNGVLKVYYDGYFSYDELSVYGVEFDIVNLSENDRTSIPLIVDSIKRYYSGKYDCTYESEDMLIWSRGYEYVSNVDEQIRLYMNAYDISNPISIWLLR